MVDAAGSCDFYVIIDPYPVCWFDWAISYRFCVRLWILIVPNGPAVFRVVEILGRWSVFMSIFSLSVSFRLMIVRVMIFISLKFFIGFKFGNAVLR